MNRLLHLLVKLKLHKMSTSVTLKLKYLLNKNIKYASNYFVTSTNAYLIQLIVASVKTILLIVSNNFFLTETIIKNKMTKKKFINTVKEIILLYL